MIPALLPGRASSIPSIPPLSVPPAKTMPSSSSRVEWQSPAGYPGSGCPRCPSSAILTIYLKTPMNLHHFTYDIRVGPSSEISGHPHPYSTHALLTPSLCPSHLHLPHPRRPPTACPAHPLTPVLPLLTSLITPSLSVIKGWNSLTAQRKPAPGSGEASDVIPIPPLPPSLPP